MPSEIDLKRCFGNHNWPHQRLSELSESIRLALPMLPGETRDVVRLLDEKIDIIGHQLAYPAPEQIVEVNLSHEGLDFTPQNAEAISPEDYLGIHLALPCGHLICGAQVSHCTSQRVGIQMRLNPTQTRILSRHLMRESVGHR